MAKVDNVRNNLIDKIMLIRNEDILLALDKLISTGSFAEELVEFTEEQELMLQMSEDDILQGRTIPESSLKAKTEEWLKNRKG
ncbi:MAG TPA: hypothetical protein VK921_03465 [Anditalea sp.]|nr:hypothetical protein [Anditalea sp.]